MSDVSPSRIGQLSPDGRWRWDGADWQPVPELSGDLLPAWVKPRVRSRATPAIAACAILIGLLTDQALRPGTFGLAASFTLAVAALLLAAAGALRRTESRVLLGCAAVLGCWLALRASPWLLWPDLAASLALLVLGASFALRGSLLDLGAAELGARALQAGAHLVAGAAFIARPLFESRRRIAGLGPFVRGLVIAAPIAVLLCVLLASADPVFASFFNLNFDLNRLLLDLLFVAVGTLVMAGLLRLAASEPIDRLDGPAWRLGPTETMVVLAVLDTVFAAFAIAQLLAATGAAADTLRSAGITYADYARSGFFQLLWVSGITLVLLVVFSRIADLSTAWRRAAFLVLAEVAIGLTVMIVVVAFRRLSLYEEAYGFTMLRLYSHIFAGWIAVVFLLLAADLAGAWRRRRWFVGAASATALAILLGLNVVSPEALVVALNTNHARITHRIDPEYLAGLSSDAVPALLDSTSSLDPALRRQVKDAACAGPRSYAPAFAAFNWADAQAAAARRSGC